MFLFLWLAGAKASPGEQQLEKQQIQAAASWLFRCTHGQLDRGRPVDPAQPCQLLPSHASSTSLT